MWRVKVLDRPQCLTAWSPRSFQGAPGWWSPFLWSSAPQWRLAWRSQGWWWSWWLCLSADRGQWFIGPQQLPPDKEPVQARRWLTRHDVAADNLPTKRGQRLGHYRDDAPTGGLHIGGPTTRGWYPGPDGTNSWSGVGGLGSCGYILGLLTNLPLLSLSLFHVERCSSPVGWVTSFVVMIAPLLLTTMMGDELLLDRATDEGLGRILLGWTCCVIILTPAEEQCIKGWTDNKQ